MRLVEKHTIKRSNQFYKELDNAAFLSKNLYNATLYAIRQHFFETGEFLDHYTLQKQFQETNQPDYTALPRKVSQKIMKGVHDAFISFFKANAAFRQTPTKFKAKPRIPNYKDTNKGRNLLKYTYQAISKKVLDNEHKIKLSGLELLISTTHTYDEICEVRVVPNDLTYTIEIVYEIDDKPLMEDNGLYAAIDLGVSNFATMTSNKTAFQPVIVSGKEPKSYNRYYNKELAKIKSVLATRNKVKTSNRIKRLTAKRNNKLSDFIHKASRMLVNQLVSEGISTLVVGHNNGWKQDTNIGRVNNQNFVFLPFDMFIKALEYKCALSGIRFIVTEESYTSKCSFLDLEAICKHDVYAGKRIHRGLFRSSVGRLINADVNGSYNILRKCMPKAFADGVEGVVVHPRIIKIQN